MRILIAIYRANPFRPHCSAAGHVFLCRLLGMNVGTAPWCPANDN